jgi:hypothetical protein
MSIRADPFMVMDRRQHAEEHARLANILEDTKKAAASASNKRSEAEAMRAMKIPKGRMETVERPAKMKQQQEGAALMHLEY